MAPVDTLHLIGTTLLGKYAVESIVDDGGAALVYKANHTLWRRPVAIKVFRSLAPLPDNDRERIVTAFLAETAELAKLSERTSAIVQARDVGQISVDGVMVPFMVLEWIDGIPIDQLLDEETAMHLPPRDLGEAIFLMEPVVEALALAHKVGVYHRNIRPSKVVLLGDPRGLDCTIKLLDMGIADLDPEWFTGEHPSPVGPAGEVLSRNTALHQTGLAADLSAVARLVRALVQGTMPPPRSNDPTHHPIHGDTDRNTEASSPMDATPALAGTPSEGARLDLVCKRAEGEGEPFGSITDFWNALRGTIFLPPMSADGSDSAKRSLPPRPSAQLSAVTAELVSAKTEFAPSVPPPSAAAPTPKAAVAPSLDQRPRAAVSKAYLSVGLSLLLLIGTFLALRRTSMSPEAREGDPSSVSSGHGTLATLAPSLTDTLCPQDMVYVSEAEFVMGNQDPGSYSVERPAHKVRLNPFCLDRTEVTVAAYKECSDKGQCLRAGDRNESADIPAQDLAAYNTVCHGLAVGDKSKHPVNCVDWAQADAYCRYRGLRLPTEAEWEYAARGHESRTYPWGMSAPLPLLVNACGPECSSWASYHGITINKVYPDSDGFETTAPVGSFPKGASPFGALDMAGNVWEWVADYFDKYTVAEAKNPQGPDKGTDRVIRGGGWNAPESGVLRATFRHHAPPTKRSHGIGFRCARDGSIAKATLP